MQFLKLISILLLFQVTQLSPVEPKANMITLIVKENLITSETETITVPVYSPISATFKYSPDDVYMYYCHHYTDGRYYGYHDKAHAPK